jgi:hypothetical protein
MIDAEKRIKKKLWRIMEKHGLWNERQHRFIREEYRESLYSDICELIEFSQERIKKHSK